MTEIKPGLSRLKYARQSVLPEPIDSTVDTSATNTSGPFSPV